MPLENVSTFCATCGLPMRTSRCDACGGNAQPLPLEDGDALATLARGEASPLAREAWSRRDWASFVSHALTVEGVTDVRSTRLSDGPGFSAVVRGVATLVAVRQNAQQIVLEAPVARLPQTMIVPALRVLLEASHDAPHGARFAVRDDLVVARIVGRLDQDTPIAFGQALRGLVTAANEMADRLVASVDARMLAPSEHQALDFDTMPAGRFLGRIAHAAQAVTPAPSAAVSRRPQVNPFRQGGSSAVTSTAHAAVTAPPAGTATTAPQAATSPPAGHPTRPPGRASGAFEALLAPAPPPQHLPMPIAPEPFSTPGDEVPAILSAGPPHPGSPRPDPAKSPRPVPAAPASQPEAPARPAPNVAKTVEVPLGPALKPPPRGPSMRPTPIAVPTVASPKTPIAAERPTTGNAPTVQTAKAVEPAPARQADLIATQVSMAPPPPGPKALCDLLHKAQTLGAVLSFADQPATMLLLVRATVYRGVFEFGEGAPGAVAELFEKTRELTKEIHITAPGKRRGTMAIPQAETAFDIFGEIVAAGGVRPSAGPPAIEPITTAQDAKQHLARYVSEIDQAPADIEVRHFLGIGALCELVVRTKLPPQTLDRVRGIIGRALKEGPRQSSIELMMTALNRIIGG